MPRIALAGNNLAAAYTLDLVLGVVAPGDVLALAPPGPQPSWHVSLGTHADERGVMCLTPKDVNDPAVVAAVADHDPALFLSVYYTQVFWGELMEVIAGRAVNFHPSLLPRHRGNAPLIWAIAEGDSTTGLTVHHIDEGIDTGRVIRQHTYLRFILTTRVQPAPQDGVPRWCNRGRTYATPSCRQTVGTWRRAAGGGDLSQHA